jgi:hypothetical protein
VETFSRHSVIKEILRQAFSPVSVPTLLEPPGMLRADGKRADGLTLVLWSRGKCLVWDATCTDRLCRSSVGSTSRSPGAAAKRSERRKRDVLCTLLCTAITIHVLSFCSGDYANFRLRSPPICKWPRKATSRIFEWRQRDDLVNTTNQRGYLAWQLATPPVFCLRFPRTLHSTYTI